MTNDEFGDLGFVDLSTDGDEKLTVICHANGKLDFFFDDTDGGLYQQLYQVTDLVITCK